MTGDTEKSLILKLDELLSQRQAENDLAAAVTELKEVVKEVNNPDHLKHHEFIDNFIEEQKARREFWCGVKANIMTGSIWATLGALASVCIYGFKQYVATGGAGTH